MLSGRGFACGRSVDPWMDNRGTSPGDCSGLGGLYFSATGCDWGRVVFRVFEPRSTGVSPRRYSSTYILAL